ncbi:MAG TPA: N-acetylglucosamine-6-phosphate deacetylase [Candidatus Binataceae bacterium]|nr:N-acetylglucosamine-6-phosphate deacetylase [Candidatus Binataceae bacterium]
MGRRGILSFDDRIARFERRVQRIEDRLLPGFIDLQINGAFGIDVMSATVDELLILSRRLLDEGTTAWLPTVITSPLEAIERCDRIIAEAMASQRELEHLWSAGSKHPPGAAILGMHLEGPFISPARRGAHPPLNLLPQADALERVLRLKTLKLITLAPELDGALEAIGRLAGAGKAVSLGHSDATFDQAMDGVAAGARMFTHAFNAMRPLHHREPGIAGAALDADAFTAIIPDGVHVHPAVLRTIWFRHQPGRTLFTTDRIAPAEAENCAAKAFGGLIGELKVAGAAGRTADGTLAGSVITMLDGVRLMNDYARIGFFGAFRAACANPAAVLGLHKDRGTLDLGARADLLLFDRDFKLKTVFVGGREIA